MDTIKEILLKDKITDYRFKVPCYEQFLIDNRYYKFSKLCMTEIVNADMMMAVFGEIKYYNSCADVLKNVLLKIRELGLKKEFFVYTHSYKNFIITATDCISDEDFQKMMYQFYLNYELATSDRTMMSGISRFALVFGGENLIDRAKSSLYVHRHMQKNFIIVENERERIIEETQDNFVAFELIKYAINNDTITPYYQGIRDNISGEIKKYEALMRIVDSDGVIHSPNSFLEASKKLKLYNTINKLMIDKALKEFEERDCELSVNISMYDILSEEFKHWFLARVKIHPKPENVIVEFVETENYNDNSELIDFLEAVKKIGCQIAVDDFGAGYATYSSIVSLKPNIIKVDGDIIKNIASNNENKIILESICYMAKLINSKIVAEFVENEEIQKIILANGVDFSQGYHFSIPTSLSELPASLPASLPMSVSEPLPVALPVSLSEPLSISILSP